MRHHRQSRNAHAGVMVPLLHRHRRRANRKKQFMVIYALVGHHVEMKPGSSRFQDDWR